MTDADEFLAHFGVKGMKWGKRKVESSGSDEIPSHARATYNNAVKTAKKVRNATFGVALGASLALGANYVAKNGPEIMGSVYLGAIKHGPQAKKGAAFAAKMLESSVKNLPYAKIAKGAYKVTSLR